MNQDLKIIKKKYGEEMAHFCRDAFPTILEQEGVLASQLLKWFEPSKFLYKDLQQEDLEMSFKDFIYKQFDEKREEQTNSNIKTPQELLSEAGYNLYECKSEEDIQSFKKYYAPGEELCTFRKNENRLEKCYVFFAVKKNIDTIKREDFKNPQRQDLYGTSVISIQFDRNPYHILSIKNRYNHTVNYCDSTFSNNLDNIIEGLTDSFAKHYGLEQSFVNQFEIPSYVQDSNGKYYKYNYEINTDYFCPNNIILKQHEPIRLPKERYILADCFAIDMKENTISNYGYDNDSFLDMFQDNPIKNICVETKTNSKIIKLETMKGLVTLEIDNENRLIGLDNPYVEEIGNHFLEANDSLAYLNLPNVKKIGDSFLFGNTKLSKLNLPNVKNIGNNFLYNNNLLENLDLENVVEIGSRALNLNKIVSTLDLPNVQKIGYGFLAHNTELSKLSLPNVLEIDDEFLLVNTKLAKLDLPNILEIGSDFIRKNTTLSELNLPNVKKIGSRFLLSNNTLTNLSLKNLIEVGNFFLPFNNSITNLNLENIEIIGNFFMKNNHNLAKICIPNNEQVYEMLIKQHPEYIGKIEMVEKEERKR